MAFTKITDADLQGKGVVGQAPVPGLPVKEMQESVEQIVREVAIPGINRLADELSAQTAAKNIGMQVPDGMPGGASANVSSIVATHVLAKGNPHNVTAEQVGAYTKEQTDQAISQKVQDIGAGDMSKAEYAPTGTYGAVDRALSADRASQSDDGVKVYTHSKSGTVHEFTGAGANGRALMTADVQAGDTFTVNGAPVTAYMGTDDAAGSMAGSAWNGKWVSFIVEDGTLNFKGGGGLTAADRAALVPNNLRAGLSILNGSVVGTARVADALIACGISATSTRATQGFYMYQDAINNRQSFTAGTMAPTPVELPLSTGKYKLFWNFYKGSGEYLGPNIYCGDNSINFPSSQQSGNASGEIEFEVTNENKLFIAQNSTGTVVVAPANAYYWHMLCTITKIQ